MIEIKNFLITPQAKQAIDDGIPLVDIEYEELQPDGNWVVAPTFVTYVMVEAVAVMNKLKTPSDAILFMASKERPV